MTGDHAGGITIDSDDVTLDCDGYKVTGPGVVGIFLAPGSQGVTVIDCHIMGFSTATHVDSSWNGSFFDKIATGNRFENNTVDSNSTGGINLSNSTASTVIGNTFINNGWSCGISLYRSSGNTVEDNEISGGTKGVCLTNSSSNTVVINNVVNGAGNGFNLTGSISNLLDGNIATSNAGSGIYLGPVHPDLTTGNTLTGNTLTSNSTGILLADGMFNGSPIFSNNNLIYNNSLISNGTQIGNPNSGIGNVFNLAAVDGGANFWSDYAGCSNGFDGFCDAPFSVDNLPLISPFDKDDSTSDFDTDGIAADVDQLPIDSSSDFSDGSTTGTVDDPGGQSLTISDAANPLDGVRIQADGPTGDPATVSVIGVAGILSLDGGDDVIVTFSSVGLEVIEGPVEATPPVLTVSGDNVVPATSLDGAVVNYPAALAEDTENPDPVVGCYLPAGSEFGLGITTVDCSANDAFPGDSVSWWPAEGNADDAAHSNDGVLVGGAGFGPGTVGQAFSFDGGARQHISIPHSASLNLTQLTLSAWIQADSDVSTGRTISAKDANDGQPVFMRNWWSGLCTPSGLDCDPGQLLFSGTTTESGSRVFWSFTGGDPLNDGVPHHVAVTYDGVGSAQIFIDGSPVPTTSIQGAPGAPDFTNEPAYIGNLTPAANNGSFLGLIDEVRIFDRPLSASEVLRVFNAPGNGATDSFTVTVEDITPPEFTVIPAPLTVQCTGPDGVPATDPVIQQWLEDAAAVDLIDGSVQVTNDIPETCALGVTLVTFTATDSQRSGAYRR